MSFIKTAISAAIFTFAATANADINKGLVGYWSFDDCTAVNQATNANNGTINGSPKCVPGAIGNGLLFNGSSDYIDISDTTEINAQNITISVWVNPITLDANSANTMVISKEEQYQIGIFGKNVSNQDVGPGELAFAVNPNWYSFSAGHYKPRMNEFFHVALIYNSTKNQAAIYVNGKLKNTVTYTSSIQKTTSCLRIGARGCLNGSGSPWGFFNGIIDEVRIYNRAITIAEVQALYYQNNPPTIKGTAPWVTPHVVTCENLTQGLTVSIPQAKTGGWDCENSGLSVKSGDKVKVTIEGTRF